MRDGDAKKGRGRGEGEEVMERWDRAGKRPGQEEEAKEKCDMS